MDSRRAAWLLPVAVFLAGLAVTAGITAQSQRSQNAEREQAGRATAAALDSVIHSVQSNLEQHSSQVDLIAIAAAEVAAQQAASGGDDDAQAEGDASQQIDQLLSSAATSEVVAVVGVHRDSVVMSPAGAVSDPAALLSPPTQGSVIDSGEWAGYMAYRHVGADQGSEGLVVLDPKAIRDDVESGRDGVVNVRLLGLPGDERLATDTSEWEQAGGVAYGPGGYAVGFGTAELFGQPLQIEASAGPTAAWRPEEASSRTTVGLGLMLSVLAGVGVFAILRRMDFFEAERDAALRERDHAAERFRSSVRNSPISVAEVDSSGIIRTANPRLTRQLGFLGDDLVGTPLADIVDSEDRVVAARAVERILSGEVDDIRSERRYRRRNGTTVWVRESISTLGADGDEPRLLIQAEDISEERRARAELHRKALFDSLTGLPNRSNLIATLSRALEADRGPNDLLAVLFVDLHQLRHINETFGHEAGDLLLVEVASRLRGACRSSDTAARLGGDEFVVVCEALPSETQAEQVAERFVSALRAPLFHRGSELPVDASFGLVVTNEQATADEILRQSGQALQQARGQEGVHLVRFEAHSAHPPADIDLAALAVSPHLDLTTADLERALAGGELRLHYQPIRRCHDSSVVGFEVLLRWQHPEHGVLSAGQFLALAEEGGLMTDLDAWVLREGLTALARWDARDVRCRDWFLTFNVAPANFADRSFPGRVRDLLSLTGIDPHRVILERNETSFMTQPPRAVLATHDLRAMGVQIALDHFGTGGGSLLELSTVDFDVLKIDRSFVRHASTHSTHVLEAMQQMGDLLGLKVVLEGIETAGELRIAVKAGIPLAQGYFLGHPTGETEVLAEHLTITPA